MTKKQNNEKKKEETNIRNSVKNIIMTALPPQVVDSLYLGLCVVEVF